MKKILLFLIIIASFSPLKFTHANWVAPKSCTLETATDLGSRSGTINFPKKEGQKSLCLKQLNKINIYSTIYKNIVIDPRGNCSINYLVNGVPWDGKNAIPINTWVLNGSYYCYESSRPDPNASYYRWDLYQNEYWYDITKPLCGELNLYSKKNDPSSKSNYSSGWTNQFLYARVQCNDYYSGCPKEDDGITNKYSDYYPLSHNATKIDISFKDLVNNQGTPACNLQGKYLYDPIKPEIFSITDDLKNNIIDTNTTLNYFAGPRKWEITVVDPFEYKDVGISGVKMIQAELFRVKDTYNNSIIAKKVCGNTQLYMLTDNILEADIEELTLDCSDTSGVQMAGTYELNINIEDYAGNKINSVKTIYIAPNKKLTPTLTRTSYEKTSTGNILSSNIFANTEDYYKYDLKLVDSYNNPIHSKAVTNFIHRGSGIFINDVDKTGGSALLFNHSYRLNTIDQLGGIGFFTIRSYVGGTFGEKFAINIPEWDSGYNNIGNQTIEFNGSMGKFSKFFTAKMVLGSDETDVIFGQKQSLDFELFRHDKAKNIISNAKINFINSLKGTPYNVWSPTNLSYSGTSEKVSQGGFIDITNTNTLAATGTVLFIPEIQVRFTGVAGIESRPVIQYEFNNKKITYQVSDELDSSDPLTLNGGEINSIYVGGYEQSQGKGQFVSNNLKIGQNSWATVSNTIKKNAALLTRNRTVNDNKSPNGVRYVSGDQTLKGNVDWNTLIVIDGNVTISDNFNTEKRNIGIILLKNKDLNKSNLYIKPNVAFISSMIYADGSIQSVNGNGDIFTSSNKDRTTTLSKQIVFHGGLYTRNTVGGAILGGDNNKYMLPGGVPTENIQDAIRYDLSFLRMKNEGNNDNNWTKKYNEGRKESVVIFINEANQINPPPGFTK